MQRVFAGSLIASLLAHALILQALPSFERPEIRPMQPLVAVLVPPLMPVPPLPQARSDAAPRPEGAPPRARKRIRAPETAEMRTARASGALRESESLPVAASPLIAPRVPADDAPPIAAATAAPAPRVAHSPVTAPAASEASSAAPVIAPSFDATYLRNPPPQYPLLARRKGEQGTVMLRVLVRRNGEPGSVSLEQTSGSERLDAAALDTVRRWRFVPARQNGQPVDAPVLVPIVFRLQDAS